MIQILTIIVLACAFNFSESGEQKEVASMSIEELYQYCNSPAPCGKPMACEGEKVCIRGYIDWDNIFFKEEYPQLPYEKFKMYDKKSGKRIEVWVNADIARVVYQKIQQQGRDSGKEVFVKGAISGFDMPVMGKCSRGIKIELERAEDIGFR